MEAESAVTRPGARLPSLEPGLERICPAWSTNPSDYWLLIIGKYTIIRHENEKSASLERVKKESSIEKGFKVQDTARSFSFRLQ